MVNVIYLGFFLIINLGFSKALTLEDFEQEVMSKNKTALALKNNVDAFQKKNDEPSLLISPQVFANFVYSHDERETLNPQIMGLYTNAKAYEVGLKQQTPWGQQYSLSYKSQYTYMNGVALANANAYEVGPKLELTQSLWRNFFGTETRAQQDLIRAQNSYSYNNDLFNYQQLKREIKLLYLNYFIAKESYRLQSEALKRAQEIRDWTKRRSQRELGEESDYLQAQAQVISKEFEVKVALDMLNTISRKFQTMRGANSDTEIEAIEPIDQSQFLSFAKVKDYKTRTDVEALKSKLELAKNQSAISAERYKPQLELYGQLAYQGREPKYSDAKQEAWDKDYEWWAVGIRFSAPIFFLDAWNTTSAYDQEQQSALHLIDQKETEALSDWKNLNEELQNQKEKYKLSQQLVAIQKKKIDVERKKLKQGRTTTYQVLTFELDYLNSELLFLKSQNDLMSVATELALYQ